MFGQKICFCLRDNYLTHPGGDIQQMLSWKQALEELQCQVTILSGKINDSELSNADAVFVWQLERPHESYQYWILAKKLHIPVVMVPTCWSPKQPDWRRIMLEQAKIWARALRHGNSAGVLGCSWQKLRDRMLNDSELLIVNSEAEKAYLHAIAPNRSLNVTLVPNVYSQDELDKVCQAKDEQRKMVVCLGHFCPRKNQLALIEALKNSDISITFIGGARPMHRRYYKRCLKAANGRHNFTGALPHDEVIKFLAQSRGAICASICETPGICNLEAAALGCRLVVPDIAPVREYFGDYVGYIDPENINPEQVLEGLKSPTLIGLSEHIRKNYQSGVLKAYFERLEI